MNLNLQVIKESGDNKVDQISDNDSQNMGCPFISERCERGRGEYWPNISHIPNIQIDFKDVQIDGQLQLDSGPSKIKGNESGQEINDKDDMVEMDKIQDSNFEYEADEQLEVHIDESG